MTTPTPLDPAGSVTFRVADLTLPDLRSGGSGLRVVVKAPTPTLTVRRLGGGGAVSACAATGPDAPVSSTGCVDLKADSPVTLSTGAVEFRATGAGVTVEEVSVTYAAVSRSTTVITPSRPAGACASRPCDAVFSLTPGRPGPFVLDGQAAGGRSRLVLTAVPTAGGSGSNRMLATVEGGAELSIRATLEPNTGAELLHHEQGADAISPLRAEILWP